MKNTIANKIEVSDKLRPCLIFNTNSCGERYSMNALFHMWVKTENLASYPNRKGVMALVEYEDGTVDLIHTTRIQFLDPQHKEYYFEEGISDRMD